MACNLPLPVGVQVMAKPFEDELVRKLRRQFLKFLVKSELI
eukprot:COSAG06_NODE_4643_length_4072_cov_3.169142_2_plen_41_part_00